MSARENFEGPRVAQQGTILKGGRVRLAGRGGRAQGPKLEVFGTSEFRISDHAILTCLAPHASWAMALTNRFSMRLILCSWDHQREVVDSRAFQGV